MVFAVNGAMGVECNAVFNRIAELISIKKDIPKSVVTNFIRTKISFCLLRTMLTCVRGSRSHKLDTNISETDINIAYCCKISTHTVNTTYDKIVFWRKNLFLLPTGSCGKKCIEEILLYFMKL